MAQYPAGIITENLYTSGGKFVLNKNPYIGYYHQIADKYYTESTQTDNSKELTLLSDFIKQQVPEKSSYDSTKFYFIRKINDKIIRNVGVNEYNKVKNNPSYTAIEVDSTDPVSVFEATNKFPEIKNLIG
jgi:hypothetical protein